MKPREHFLPLRSTKGPTLPEPPIEPVFFNEVFPDSASDFRSGSGLVSSGPAVVIPLPLFVTDLLIKLLKIAAHKSLAQKEKLKSCRVKRSRRLPAQLLK